MYNNWNLQPKAVDKWQNLSRHVQTFITVGISRGHVYMKVEQLKLPKYFGEHEVGELFYLMLYKRGGYKAFTEFRRSNLN